MCYVWLIMSKITRQCSLKIFLLCCHSNLWIAPWRSGSAGCCFCSVPKSAFWWPNCATSMFITWLFLPSLHYFLDFHFSFHSFTIYWCCVVRNKQSINIWFILFIRPIDQEVYPVGRRLLGPLSSHHSKQSLLLLSFLFNQIWSHWSCNWSSPKLWTSLTR